MKKMKLEDRISLGYILLFLLLMLISNIALVYILQNQNKKVLVNSMVRKSNEINDFLNKVLIFSERNNNLTLQFTPRVDGQRVVYSKPFNPGEENLFYLLKIEHGQGESEIPLNTISTIDSNVGDAAGEEIIKEIEKHNVVENDARKGKVITINKDDKYYVIKITREIKGNKFISYVLKDIRQEMIIFRRLEWLTVVALLIGIVVTIIISRFLSKRILRPVNNVIKTAQTITTDDLSKRIENPHTGDELEKLTTIINQMLDRIENSFDNQSKFVSDASHELRTPLAIIKGYAEIIKKRKLSNPEIFEESIDSIINEADNMKNLVEKLLFLARGEMSKVNASFREIEVDEMVEQIHSDMIVSVKTHKFVLEKSQKYMVKAEETLLQQAIRAIIENAIKYSEKDTTIYINSEIDKNTGRISIRDEGVGMKEEDRKRVFDRFYRVDDSRTKSTGGFGLGLAIVRRIVELHNGKIDIDSKYGIGTTITLVLPIINNNVEQLVVDKKEKNGNSKLKLGLKNLKKNEKKNKINKNGERSKTVL